MAIDRRDFVQTLSLAGLGGLTAAATSATAATPSAAAQAQASAGAAPQPAKAAVAGPKDVTRVLARYVVTGGYDDHPAAVRKEAQRTLLNWTGCALGGCRHETLDIAIAALAPFSGPAQASVLGRSERLDIMHAALMNGISSHVLDFDDTHLKTVIHPAGPVVSAILALAEYRAAAHATTTSASSGAATAKPGAAKPAAAHPVTGRDFVDALIRGVEVECRIGNAVYPAHYDRGWHITGTTGVFGAAAACGKLLGLSEQQMVWALGLAAAQPVGLREMFGSMTKSFHPGRAAQNGLTAALLAARNFTSAEAGLEGKNGWANVLSTAQDYSQITDNLGKTYELSLNTYKPFACGIVIHPTIDACIQLRNEHTLKADQIERIDLRVHPLVLELTGKKTPATGLESKFSVYFAAAIAIVHGAAGMHEFSDQNAQNATIIALRDRVRAVVDPTIKEDQVRATITLKDGRTLDKFVEHVVGSLERPMSDTDLEAKFTGLADGVLPAAKVRALMDLCWKVDTLPNAAALATAALATAARA